MQNIAFVCLAFFGMCACHGHICVYIICADCIMMHASVYVKACTCFRGVCVYACINMFLLNKLARATALNRVGVARG